MGWRWIVEGLGGLLMVVSGVLMMLGQGQSLRHGRLQLFANAPESENRALTVVGALLALAGAVVLLGNLATLL